MNHTLKSYRKRVWSDPVWGAVIAAVIAGVILTVVGGVIKFVIKKPEGARPSIVTHGDRSPVYMPGRDYVQNNNYHETDPVLLRELVSALNANTEEKKRVRLEMEFAAVIKDQRNSLPSDSETDAEKRQREREYKEAKQVYAQLEKKDQALSAKGDDLIRRIKKLSERMKPAAELSSVNEALRNHEVERDDELRSRSDTRGARIKQVDDAETSVPVAPPWSSASTNSKGIGPSVPNHSLDSNDVSGSISIPLNQPLDNLSKGGNAPKVGLPTVTIDPRIENEKWIADTDIESNREHTQRQLLLEKKIEEIQDTIARKKQKNLETERQLISLETKASNASKQFDKSFDATQLSVTEPLSRLEPDMHMESVKQKFVDNTAVAKDRLEGKRDKMSAGLKHDSRIKETRLVQDYLNRHGFDAGPVDGISGPQTRGALAELQRSKQLEATGLLTENLVKKIREWDENEVVSTIGASRTNRRAFVPSEEKLTQSSRNEAQRLHDLDARPATSKMVVPGWQFDTSTNFNASDGRVITPEGLEGDVKSGAISPSFENDFPSYQSDKEGVYSGNQTPKKPILKKNDTGATGGSSTWVGGSPTSNMSQGMSSGVMEGVHSGNRVPLSRNLKINNMGATTGGSSTWVGGSPTSNMSQGMSSGVMDLNQGGFGSSGGIQDPAWSNSGGIQGTRPSSDGFNLDTQMPGLPSNRWE